MITAIVVTLLISMFFDGPEEIFMYEDFNKEVKSIVEDKYRKKEILAIVKEARKEIKYIGKKRKKALKQIAKLSGSREVSTEEMLEIYDAYFNSRKSSQIVLIDSRLAMQELVTDDEWQKLVVDQVAPTKDKKEKKKMKKADKKEDKETDRIVDKIKAAITKHIADPEKRKEVLRSVDDFDVSFHGFVEQGRDLRMTLDEMNGSRNTTRQELEDFYQIQNDARLKAATDYFQVRDAVLKNTDEDEWKAITKALQKITRS